MRRYFAADRAGRNHHQCSHDEHRDPPAFRVAALFHDEEDEPRGDTEPTERVEPKCVTAPPECVQEDTDDHHQATGDEGRGGAVFAAR